MMGRREFGMAGLSAAAVLAMQASGVAQPGNRDQRGSRGGADRAAGAAHDHGHDDHGMSDECARACSDCQRECDACANHCTDLLTQGRREHAETLRVCQDCADICATAAGIVARRGPFSAQICTACADTCAACGEHCESHGEHDETMKRCAEACRRCEEACRQMAGHGDHDEHHEGGARR